MKKIVLVICLGIFSCLLQAQLNGPVAQWSQTYGGASSDYAHSVQQTSDGGYIVAGHSYTFGEGSSDFYMVKTTAAGNETWSQTYGGEDYYRALSVQQTNDGGFVIAGHTGSHWGEDNDFCLVKTDAAGNETWVHTYGGISDDRASCVQQASDGGYIIAGYTYSFGAGNQDLYLVKTDATGNKTWSQTYGGTSADEAQSVQQTSDGGYIIAGYTNSYGAGSSDFCLVKTDAAGNETWTQTYGGTSTDEAQSVQQTTDGGYIVAGYTRSFGAGNDDYYLIKTDASGNETWSQTYGGTSIDKARSVQQASDGGYIIAGYTSSFGAGYNDYYLVKSFNPNAPNAPDSLAANLSGFYSGYTIDLSWNNPATTASGEPLTDLQQIEITRNGELISTIDTTEPGVALSYADVFEVNIGGQIDYTYNVYAVNPYGNGVFATTTVNQWIGPSIQGFCQFSNTSNCEGIKVKFAADANSPTAVTDSTYTSATGWYGIELPTGTYDITFSYPGYMPVAINNFFYEENQIIATQTLYPSSGTVQLAGDVSGVLEGGKIYEVTADINVPAADSLVIAPNTIFYFHDNVNFDIYGKIVAEGTNQQPVRFTNIPGSLERGLMKLYQGSYEGVSSFTNCIFEQSNTVGLLLQENAQISWCQFNDNQDNGLYLVGNNITRELTTIQNSQFFQNAYHGISCSSASPTVENCIINNNTGSGVYASGSPLIGSCSIFQNQQYGVYSKYSTRVENCEIYENNDHGITAGDNSEIFNNEIFANNFYGVQANDNTIISGNIIYNNSSYEIRYYSSDNQTPCLINNTILGNVGFGSLSGVVKNNIIRDGYIDFNGKSPTVEYNNFESVSDGENIPGLLNGQNVNANGTACDPYGNISEDPLFYSETAHNYHLTEASPCINAGDPSSELDPDGTVADMGALYYDLNANSHAQLQLPVNVHNFLATVVDSSRSWFCSIINSGTEDLQISSVEFDNDVFSIPVNPRTSYPTDVSLAPGDVYQMEVIFTPTAEGASSGTMTINSNAMNQPAATVELNGMGTVNPDILLSMNVNEHHNVMENFDFPINISATDGYNITSYNISISYDPTILTCDGVDVSGTLSADFSVSANTTIPGMIIIGAAGSEPLSGEGILCNLQFTVSPNIQHGTATYLNIEEAIVNEDDLAVVGTYGSVVVENVYYGDVDENELVQAYDGALVLQYSVMLDPLPLIDPRPWEEWRVLRADVSGDGNILAYDASLILQYLLGIITEFPVETEDKNIATEGELICQVQANSIVVSSNDLSQIFGCNINIPAIEGIEMGEVQFSDEVSSYLTNTNQDIEGLHIALASAQPAEGAGELCYIPFVSNTNTEVTLDITLNDQSYEQSLQIATTENGQSDPLPAINSVKNNYPNPFNPETTINFSLKEESDVSIVVYNSKGQVVKRLLQTRKSAGYHDVVWQGVDEQGKAVASGLYLCKVKIGNNFERLQKMLLMK